MGAHFHIKSQLPLSAGLGSSAAYNTSLTLACLVLAQLTNITCKKLFGIKGVFENDKITPYGLELLQKYSYLCEKFMHGNPSGIDNTVATYGNDCFMLLTTKVE